MEQRLMKKVEIEIRGQRMFGAVARDAGTTWFSLNGEVWTTESAATGRAVRGSLASAAGDASQVRAPMPGKIIKVLASVGTTVKVGDTLIVMEAMKMEYTLKAAATGVVQEISCEVGQQVALGSTLAKLKV
jgi:biotin carboxyl carrier protein